MGNKDRPCVEVLNPIHLDIIIIRISIECHGETALSAMSRPSSIFKRLKSRIEIEIRNGHDTADTWDDD